MLKKEIKKKNLIEILELESLPPEAQVEVVDSAVDVIEMRCLNEVLESLDTRGKKRFVKLMDAGDAEEVGIFLKDKSIDLMQILDEEVLRFKTEAATAFSR
ncbi:MAG: hypothetical protein OXB96_02985 [Candidatus Kaiserbacteria bacterium]|nr:hypothetical protein [Candidatus Kaiserbacteria bacterium]